MRALQMESAIALISDFESGGVAQALLDGGGPLLDVLGLLIGIERGEAGDRSPDYRGAKFKLVMDGVKASL